VNGAQISDPFGRLLAALEPWLDQIVIVGGWAQRLYRLHPDAQALDYPPLSTLDADVALSPTLMTGEQGIHARLLAFGFEEEFFGDTRPPATHYHLGGETSGFYAEFLTPLGGSEYDRTQKRKAVMEVAGTSTQQLRYIELLLNSPWSIHVEHAEFSGRIRIANPDMRSARARGVVQTACGGASRRGSSTVADSQNPAQDVVRCGEEK
jgi:hypothetical protein